MFPWFLLLPVIAFLSLLGAAYARRWHSKRSTPTLTEPTQKQSSAQLNTNSNPSLTRIVIGSGSSAAIEMQDIPLHAVTEQSGKAAPFVSIPMPLRVSSSSLRELAVAKN
jgi:hypothetical protein